MPLDPNIYSQLNKQSLAGGLGDVVNQYVDQTQADAERKNRLAQMAQAGELQGLQLQQAKQQAADETAYRQALKESGGDVSGLANKLRAQGLHTQADALIKSQAEQQKAAMEMGLKRHEGLATVAGDIAQNPTQWQTVIQNSIKAGYLHPDDAQTMAQHFSTLPSEQIGPEAQKGMVMVKDASAALAKELYTKPEWKLIETEGGQQLINPNAPNAPKQFGPKPSALSQTKPPVGYRYTANGELEPIPGGPADVKAQLLAEQKGKATEQARISAQQVLDQAEELFKHPGREAATGASSWRSMIPGSEAKGFQAELDTFKAQTFIPMVSALKGMGALSDAEGKKLSESVGALNPQMPEKEFEKSLQKVTKTLYEKAKASGLNVSLPDFAQTGQVQSAGNPLSVMAPDGSVHIFPSKAAADGFRKAIGVQ